MDTLSRRNLLRYLAAGAAMLAASPLMALNRSAMSSNSSAKKAAPLQKKIPSNGEAVTVIGMGTWQTFNVGSDPQLLAQRTQIVDLFFKLGGQMIDSSPMYGSSQQAVGYALRQLEYPSSLFSAEKVWTYDGSATRQHIEQTVKAWGLEYFDLMQIHNLLSWQDHIQVLKEMKRNGELRHIGITTSHGRRHSELEQIMTSEAVDFVQLTYNLEDREVERRLLPLAREKGIAVIANRPFQGGSLINRLQRQHAPLPGLAKEINCHKWAQFLLKFIVSHPAVTCAIPATTRLEHMQENMGTASGPLADARQREQMLAYVQSL